MLSHGAGDDIEIAPATSPQLINDLLPDTKYEIMIISNCEDGIPSQVSASFKTASETMDSCMTPQELTISVQDSGGYLLTWQSVGGAESYGMQVNKLDTVETLVVDTNIATASYLFTMMDSLHSFAYRVKTLCSSESASEYSDWIIFPAIADSLVLACESPLDLMVDTVIGNNAFVSWSNSGTETYELEILNADTSWNELAVSGSMHPMYVLSGLEPFADYQIRIRALCQREEAPFSDAVNFSTLAEMNICMPPDDLNAERADDSTAMLSWTGVDSASYQIEVKPIDPSSLISLVLPSSNPGLLVSGLNPVESYQFRVRMICAAGDTSLFSEWILFSTLDTMVMDCQSPTDLVLDSVFDTGAQISWEGPESILYRVLIKERDTIVEYDEFLTEEQFIYFDSLMSETEYQVYVQSICDEQESGLSDPLYFFMMMMSDTIRDSLCLAPTELKLDSVDVSDVWISWLGSDSSTYHVEVTGDDYEFSELTDKAMIHLTELSSDQTFQVRIRMICGEMDTSEWSEFLIFQTLEEPDEPTDSCSVPVAELLQVTGQTASVSWSASSPEAFYLIEVENIGLTPDYNLITTTRDTAYLIESLLPGGTYQWKVAAFCDGGMYSDCTPWMIIDTEGEVDCPSPSGLAAEMLTNTSAALIWAGSPGAIDYEVEIQSLDTTAFYGQSSVITENHLKAEGLVPGGIYQYKVNVQCLDGSISDDSNWYIFSTLSGQDTGKIMADITSSFHMVYPNPVHSTMTVILPETLDGSDATIELTDMMGRLIISQKKADVFGGDQLEFEVSSFREGVYKLSVRSAENQFHQLVLITK
ncbi:MAG: fibronectin type III domain-containing protein [Saprospiraceae bacterium]|nr:fibronectin type III domain-containing protein [Saprospiraceae bacterium]